MHFGRSHHLSIEIVVSVIGGFTASFLTFALTTYTSTQQSFQGQLLAGDPTLNKEFPTTLNTMHAVMDGQSSLFGSMSSYGWWVMVAFGGVFASFIVFKLARRYV